MVFFTEAKRPRQTLEEWGTFSKHGLYVFGASSNPLVGPATYLTHSGLGNTDPNFAPFTRAANQRKLLSDFERSDFYKCQTPRYKWRLSKLVSEGFLPSDFLGPKCDPRAFNGLYNKSFNVKAGSNYVYSSDNACEARPPRFLKRGTEPHKFLKLSREPESDNRTASETFGESLKEAWTFDESYEGFDEDRVSELKQSIAGLTKSIKPRDQLPVKTLTEENELEKSRAQTKTKQDEMRQCRLACKIADSKRKIVIDEQLKFSCAESIESFESVNKGIQSAFKCIEALDRTLSRLHSVRLDTVTPEPETKLSETISYLNTKSDREDINTISNRNKLDLSHSTKVSLKTLWKHDDKKQYDFEQKIE